MDLPPSPKQGLKPRLTEAIRKAAGRGIRDIIVFSGTAGLVLYFGTQANSLAIKLASIVLGCLAVFLVEIVPILLLLRGLAIVVFIGLFCWFGWLARSERSEIHRLTDAVSKARAERIDIARAGLRLAQLQKGKPEFEAEVRSADTAWDRVKEEKAELIGPELIGPSGFSASIRAWLSSGSLASVQYVARQLLGADLGEIAPQPDRSKLATAVPGEENIPNDFNRGQWRDAYYMHQAAQKFIDTVRSKINAEIDQLTQKVTAAAQQDGR
jgi:hypothetical protein